MVEGKNEDEDEAGDGGECEEDPEKNKIDFLRQKLPVSKSLADGVVLLLFFRHLVKILYKKLITFCPVAIVLSVTNIKIEYSSFRQPTR